MLRKKLKRRLINSFNEANNYQNDACLETFKRNDVVTVPTFDKGRYKRNCLLTFGLSFAVLLLVTILSTSFIVENEKGKFKDNNQFVLTDDEIDYMLERCDKKDEKPLYYINFEKNTFLTLFFGDDENTNFYYIKLDTIGSEVTVTINEETSTFNSNGFYYVGCIEKGQCVEKIDIVISRGDSTFVYAYYL